MSKDWTGNNASLYRIMGASNHSDTEREKDDFYADLRSDMDALGRLKNKIRKQIHQQQIQKS